MSKDISHLFVRDGQPIKFTIYRGKMLNVKVNKIIKLIELYGGQYLTWENYLKPMHIQKRKCTLILSDALYPEIVKYCHIYDIRWIKKCIKINKQIKLNNFRLDIYSASIKNEPHKVKPKKILQISAEKMLSYMERVINGEEDPNSAEYILERCEAIIFDKI